jgi:hypothetical protein
MAIGVQKRQVLIRQGAFYLAVAYRQIETSVSPRPLRLGGENLILDKSDLTLKILPFVLISHLQKL